MDSAVESGERRAPVDSHCQMRAEGEAGLTPYEDLSSFSSFSFGKSSTHFTSVA